MRSSGGRGEEPWSLATPSEPRRLLIAVAAVPTAVLKGEMTEKSHGKVKHNQISRRTSRKLKPRKTTVLFFFFSILGFIRRVCRTSLSETGCRYRDGTETYRNEHVNIDPSLVMSQRRAHLSPEESLQQALFGRRRRLSSPVQVRGHGAVQGQHVQFFKTLRLDHLRGITQTHGTSVIDLDVCLRI